jgi:hypothetical protein
LQKIIPLDTSLPAITGKTTTSHTKRTRNKKRGKKGRCTTVVLPVLADVGGGDGAFARGVFKHDELF